MAEKPKHRILQPLPHEPSFDVPDANGNVTVAVFKTKEEADEYIALMGMPVASERRQ